MLVVFGVKCVHIVGIIGDVSVRGSRTARGVLWSSRGGVGMNSGQGHGHGQIMFFRLRGEC